MTTHRIIKGDTVAGLKIIPKNSIHCVITSPPYDGIRDYDGKSSFEIKEMVKELHRILINGGVVVWVVGDQVINGSESGTSFRQALSFMDIGFNLHDTMLYEKTGCVFPDKTRYQQMFEYMFVFSKGKPETINLIQDRESKWAEAWGRRTYRKKNGELDEKTSFVDGRSKSVGVRGNIWRYPNGYGYSAEEDVAYEHPAIFPEALAEDHIISWSKKGDTILDPFVGSGTTIKMARKLERNSIGIEINPKYIEIMKKRLKANEQLDTGISSIIFEELE